MKLCSPEYSNDRDVYVVRADGTIRMPGRDLFLSQVLSGEPVAVELSTDGKMVVSYGPLKLGTISALGAIRTIEPRPSAPAPNKDKSAKW